MNRLPKLLIFLAGGTSLEEASREAGYSNAIEAGKALTALSSSLPGSDDPLDVSDISPAVEFPGDLGEDVLIANTDGAARGNPGPASAAAVVYDSSGTEVYSKAVRLGTATNNEAEYKGLILGLDLLHELGAREVVVRMDSELVVKQMKGEYKIKKDHLRELSEIASRKADRFDSVRYEHVPRARNARADKLAGEILDKPDRPAE